MGKSVKKDNIPHSGDVISVLKGEFLVMASAHDIGIPIRENALYHNDLSHWV